MWLRLPELCNQVILNVFQKYYGQQFKHFFHILFFITVVDDLQYSPVILSVSYDAVIV